jgi:hypothetical protein
VDPGFPIAKLATPTFMTRGPIGPIPTSAAPTAGANAPLRRRMAPVGPVPPTIPGAASGEIRIALGIEPVASGIALRSAGGG